MKEKIIKIEEIRRKIVAGGGSGAVDTQHAAGKLTARERVAKFLDPGTFYELEMFLKPIHTELPVDERTIRGDGLVSGYGEVFGRPVCVWAQDATVLSGKAGIVHMGKIVTCMERALKARIPCVGIIDSEGVRPEDVITTPTNYSYDKIMYLQTTASGVIPQLSLIMGKCIGAAAISTQLSDFVFMVKGNSQSNGPVTALGVDAQSVGEATFHFNNSGCCDVLADNDEDCIQKARNLLNFLPLHNKDEAPDGDALDDPDREVAELFDIVPSNSRKPYRVHDVIAVIADHGSFFEIRGGWAKNLSTGFARFGGRSCGIIANNPQVLGGCLDVDSADKLARFVRFCDAFNLPIVYLADTPAFLPSIEQERRGIIRHGSKAIFSNSVATTQQIQVYLRKCYGGGNLAMPGNNLGGDMGLAWPTSEILLMHPEGAVAIIWNKEISASKDPKKEFKKRLSDFREAGAVENVWEAMVVQDYINPKDTRAKITRILKLLKHKRELTFRNRHDNMPL